MLDVLLPLAAVLLWGGNAVVTKASAGVIAPAEIAFYRWLFAALLLAPVAIGPMLRQIRDLRARLVRLVILGLLGCALFPYLMYVAAQHTSAINLGIIQALMPLMAILLVSAMERTAPGGRATAGAMISLAGVALVVSHGELGALTVLRANRGDVIMFAATACFAVYSVLLQRWRGALPMTSDLFVQATTAAVVLLPLMVLGDRQGISAGNAGLVVYAAAFASIAAPLLWMHGVERVGPSRASLFFNLLPVITVALAVLLLGETASLSLLVGAGLAISGVALAESADGRRGRSAE